MKGREVLLAFEKGYVADRDFSEGKTSSKRFLKETARVSAPLIENSIQGSGNIIREYGVEGVKIVVHEKLHEIVDQAVGIPTQEIFAIEDDDGCVWGGTAIDTRAAKKTNNLRVKVKKARGFHLLIEKLNI